MTNGTTSQTLLAGADLLEQGQRIDWTSRFLTVASVTFLAPLLFWFGAPAWPLLVATAISTIAGCLQIWLAVRTGFDAAVFRRLAVSPQDTIAALSSFDTAMTGLGLMPGNKAGRGAEARVRGALRLLGLQATVFVLQLLALLSGGLMIVFLGGMT